VDLDAVASCAGEARFAPLDKLTDEDFLYSVHNKLMGQVNLVRARPPRHPRQGLDHGDEWHTSQTSNDRKQSCLNGDCGSRGLHWIRGA
jgi:hypothetical protein